MMKKKLANHVARTAFKAESALNDLIPLLKDHCSETEYKVYLKSVASIAMTINSEILNRIDLDYPEIQEEFDSEIREYGRLL